MAGGMIESCDPDGQCKGIREALLATATGEDATMSSIDENLKASDVHWIRMLTQLIAGGMIDSCDPSGRCKGILEARIAKATGERCKS